MTVPILCSLSFIFLAVDRKEQLGYQALALEGLCAILRHFDCLYSNQNHLQVSVMKIMSSIYEVVITELNENVTYVS